MLAVLLSVMHEAANMGSMQDQLAAQIDCADVCSMLGAGRKRHLLLSEVIRVLGLRGAGGNSEMLRRACDALGSQLIAAAEEIAFRQVCPAPLNDTSMREVLRPHAPRGLYMWPQVFSCADRITLSVAACA